MNKVSVVKPSRFDQTRHIGRRPVTLSSITRLILRHWLFLAIVTIAVAIAGLAASFLIKPVYDAIATIRIIPVGSSALDFSNDTSTPMDQAAVNTEVATITSRDVARRVVDQLKLGDDSEFVNPKALAKLGAAGNSPDVRASMATSAVAGHLHVEQREKSYIIQVGFKASNPAKAAAIANAWVNSYIDFSADTTMGVAARQAASGQQRLAQLGQGLQAADGKLAAYRAQAGISQGGTNGTVTDQQVAPLSVELATAESQAAAARSNLEVAERQVAAGGSDAVSAVLSSGVIADLRRQRTEVEKQSAELNARYGPKFPAVVSSEQQVDALDRQIRQEANRIIGGLRSEALAAEARAGSLRGQLSVIQGSIAHNSQTSVVADSLQRDADAKRSAYNRLADTVQQYSQARQSTEPQARVIEQAAAPAKASWPNRRAIGGGGMLLGFMMAFTIVLIREGMRSTFRTPDDLEAVSVKFLGAIQRLPRRQLKRRDGSRRGPADFLLDSPMSAYAEALRTVRTSLQSSEGRVLQLLSISSTLPAEGKTTTALSLARVMAMTGERVLLVDCDLRRAGIAKGARIKTEIGIVEVLSGIVEADEAIVRDVVEGLDLLVVPQPTFLPTDMFSGPAMRELLQQLRGKYDRIILDTPPLLGIADAQTLSPLVDGVLLVCKWDSTPVAAVDAALAGIEDKNAHVIGGVFTMVDAAAEAVGTMYYSKKYSGYYQ